MRCRCPRRPRVECTRPAGRAAATSRARPCAGRRPPRRYTALLEDRLGPFAMRADLDLTVERVDSRRMRVSAAGEDRQVASRIAATIELAVGPDGAGTSLAVTGRYEVTGKVATLGAGAIRKKGDKILQEFFDNASKELGGRGPAAQPVESPS